MRKSARIAFLFVLGMLSSVVLSAITALTAAVSLAATALIVPGTGTPNANIVENYMEHARDRYMGGTACDGGGCPDKNLIGIDYPASFFPLIIFPTWCRSGPNGCDTWNDSVGQGVQGLDTKLRDLLDNTSEDIVIFGYSQGGAVVSDELRNLGDLTPAERARLEVVVIGNAYNPDGGLFTRLGFLPTIPFLNITFGPKMPTDTGIPIKSVGFQYDPVMYAPTFWGNPFSMLTALAAFETVHGYYLTPNGNGPTDPIAYGYTPEELAEQLDESLHPENFRKDSNGNVYVMIPAKSQPVADFILQTVPAPLTPVVKPFVDLVSPVWKVLSDLGYDFSGNPGTERWLSPLPFNPIQNWPAVGVNLVAATLQGIKAFIGDLGGLTSVLPAPLAPTSTTPVLTLAAARNTSPTMPTEPADTTATVSETKQSTSKLTLVKDSETTVQQTTTVENDGTSAVADQTPVTKLEESPVTKPEEATEPAPTADEKKSDDKKDDVKKDATDKTDKTDKKDASGKTRANETKADTDKKDADSAKAAA